MLLSSVTAGVAKLESDAVRSGIFLKSKEQIKHVQRRIVDLYKLERSLGGIPEQPQIPSSNIT